MSSRYSRMTDAGYKNEAPSRRAEEIDSDIVERMRCRRCGGLLRYEPWVRRGDIDRCNSYIVYAVCENCQNVEEL